MKVLRLNEFSINESNENIVAKNWNCQYISFENMMNFVIAAINETAVDPEYICTELSSYEDPDDLWNAYDRGELKDTAKFMDEFTDLLADSDEYGGKEGDIADALFDDLYEVMDMICKK